MLEKKLFALLILLFVWVGCNSSPTVPVPPPEMIVVYAPSADGYALVFGKPGTAVVGDTVVVFNNNIGRGVVALVEEDGSFETEVEASGGDRLSIQIIRDDLISEDETVVIVPDGTT